MTFEKLQNKYLKIGNNMLLFSKLKFHPDCIDTGCLVYCGKNKFNNAKIYYIILPVSDYVIHSPEKGVIKADALPAFLTNCLARDLSGKNIYDLPDSDILYDWLIEEGYDKIISEFLNEYTI